jgi:ribosomal subunit interface protein
MPAPHNGAEEGSVQIPLDVDFQNLEPSEFITARIAERVQKLERFNARIISCRVIVECPHRHHAKGKEYHVRILLRLPGEEIVISHDPGDDRTHTDVYVAIRDAFDACERRLKAYVERLRQPT